MFYLTRRKTFGEQEQNKNCSQFFSRQLEIEHVLAWRKTIHLNIKQMTAFRIEALEEEHTHLILLLTYRTMQQAIK